LKKNKRIVAAIGMCALIALLLGQITLYFNAKSARTSALPPLTDQRSFQLTNAPPGNIFVSGRTIADDETAPDKPEPKPKVVQYRLVSIFDVHSKPTAIFVTDDGKNKLMAHQNDRVGGIGTIEAISSREVTVVGPEGKQTRFSLFKVEHDAQEKISATDKD
jgi:hypothetical protein